MIPQEEFLVMAASMKGLRCFCLPGREVVLIHPLGGVRGQVVGEILTVDIAKRWRFGNTDHISGKVAGQRIDGEILAPIPLELHHLGKSEGRERRHIYEMEQVIPGADFVENGYDPITESVEYRDQEDYGTAFALLHKCIEGDLRCIDAYVHLGLIRAGEFETEYLVRSATKSYEVALAVADRTVGHDFYGILPWSRLNNRPLHRTLQGLGICYWRLGQIDSACRIFIRLLSIDPQDRLFVRFLMERAMAGQAYLGFVNETEPPW